MRLLFIGTEISLENSPEGIVSRSIIQGFKENKWKIDLIAPRASLSELNNLIDRHYEIDAGFFLSKIKKKITGLESNVFQLNCCKLLDQLNIASYDLIFLRSDPVSIHSVALYINEKFSRRCVCSFGDAGSTNPYYSQPGLAKLRKYNLQKIERAIIDKGNIITQTNQRSIDLYNSAELSTNNFIVLPNPITNIPKIQSDESTIVSTLDNTLSRHYVQISETCAKEEINFAFLGSLYGDRKPDIMFKYLSQYNNVAVHIFGGVRNILYERQGLAYNYLKEKGLNEIRKSAAKNNFNRLYIWPFMPMSLINLLLTNKFAGLINIDANFLPNPFLSSKVVQYLSYNLPILNFTNVGATTDLLKEAGIGYFIDYANTQKSLSIDALMNECSPKVDIRASYLPEAVIRRFLQKVSSANNGFNL